MVQPKRKILLHSLACSRLLRSIFKKPEILGNIAGKIKLLLFGPLKREHQPDLSVDGSRIP